MEKKCMPGCRRAHTFTSAVTRPGWPRTSMSLFTRLLKKRADYLQRQAPLMSKHSSERNGIRGMFIRENQNSLKPQISQISTDFFGWLGADDGLGEFITKERRDGILRPTSSRTPSVAHVRRMHSPKRPSGNKT